MSKVAVVKTQNPNDAARAVDLIGGMGRFVKRGETVLVKPNICIGKPSETGAVTDPELTAAVCRLAADFGARPVVGDCPTYPYRAAGVFRKAGYGDFEKRYGFPILDLDAEKSVRVTIPNAVAVKSVVVPRIALEADRIINVPVLKTHLQTVMTLSLKNLKGLVVGKHKHVAHIAGLDAGIVDLNTLFRTDLVVVDAIIGMDGTAGPTNGKPRRVGAIIAGDNRVASDAVCCRVVVLDPERVPHIRLARERGLGETRDMEIFGDGIESVRTKFAVTSSPELFKTVITDFTKTFHGVLNPLSRLRGIDTVEIAGRAEDWKWNAERCTLCGKCIESCPTEVLRIDKEAKRLVRREASCILCFCCAEVCPEGAIARSLR